MESTQDGQTYNYASSGAQSRSTVTNISTAEVTRNTGYA